MQKYFLIYQEYTNLEYAEEAEEIINLANFLRFDMLEEAVSAALAVNYYVGNTEKEVDAFIKNNRLDQLTPSQIEEIINEHKDIYEQIEEKHKEKLMNESQNWFDENYIW